MIGSDLSGDQSTGTGSGDAGGSLSLLIRPLRGGFGSRPSVCGYCCSTLLSRLGSNTADTSGKGLNSQLDARARGIELLILPVSPCIHAAGKSN